MLEQRDGKLNHGSLSAITAAKELGGPIHGFIAGSNIKSAAEEAAKVDGVEKIVAVENEAYEKVSSPTSQADPWHARSDSGLNIIRGWQKITRLCSWRTSRKAVTAT